MARVKGLYLFIAAMIVISVSPVIADDEINISQFSSKQIGQYVPDGWEYLDFPGIAEKTSFAVIEDQRYGAVVSARALSGAGGLVRTVSRRAERYPVLNWAWKIDKTINGSEVGSRSGDDFPVRLLVSFKTRADQSPSLSDKTLCYVWADHDSVGIIEQHPFLDHIMTIVVANKNNHVGDWLEVSRNMVQDYLDAFGELPGWISAITLISDSDNTQTDTLAWYGPISLAGPDSESK